MSKAPSALAGLSSALLLLSLLAGCSPQADSITEPSQTATLEPSASPTTEAQTEAQEIRALVRASYELFETVGMTETVSSEAVEYGLLFDPSIRDYQAVILDRSTGESELIFQTDYFSLFVIYLIAESDEGKITKQAEGTYLAQEQTFGSFRFFVEDGIITAAEGEDQSWKASFEYSVDSELREVLLTKRQELLDSFTD